MTSSYKVEVLAVGEREYVSNGLRFPTEFAAHEYGYDLAWRWTGVKEWRTAPSDDQPNR